MDDTRILVALIAAFVSVLLSAFTFIQSSMKSKRDFETDVHGVRTDYMAENVAKRLLNNPDFPYRSFAILRHHLGGYGDEELRRILVRAGAIRTMSKSGHELWISLDRMTELTKQDHAFFWKIDNDPSTPDEMDLFPLAYNERKVAQSFPQGIEAASQT